MPVMVTGAPPVPIFGFSDRVPAGNFLKGKHDELCKRNDLWCGLRLWRNFSFGGNEGRFSFRTLLNMVFVECNADGPRRTVMVLTSNDEDITLRALVRALKHFIAAVTQKNNLDDEGEQLCFKGLAEN